MQMEKSLLIQIEYLQAANYLQAEDSEDQYKTHMKIVEALKSGDVELGLREITEPALRFYNLKKLPVIFYQ